MDAYMYRADIYCAPCAEEIIRERAAELGLPLPLAGIDPREEPFDSEHWPQGPYAEGGGEADYPQHCGECSKFLENPLTEEGYRYVRLALEEERGTGDVVAEWAEFYREGVGFGSASFLSPMDRAVIAEAADFLQRDIIFDEESLRSDQLAEKLRGLLS